MKLKQPILFAAGREIALNADATSLPEWIQIAPFGEFPTRDKSKIQVFNSEAAQEMISWFDFWPRRMARLAHVNCIKVYVGHPDLAPGEWPERIDLGSVVELAESEHGLNARVKWNAGALEHVRKHKFPSGAWDTDDIDAGRLKPVMLLSVGMWHKPNIKSVQPVINAVPDESTEPPEGGTTKQKPEDNTTMNILEKIKDLLIKAGLLKDTDDDDTLLSGLGSLISTIGWKREEEARQEAMTAELKTALNAEEDKPLAELVAGMIATHVKATEQINAAAAENVRLTAEITTLRTAQINATLERLLETGRVTKAEEDDARAQLNANFDEAHARLLKRGLQLNSKPVDITARRADLATVENRMAQINAWTDAYMVKEKASYDDAFAACQRDTQMKPLFEAMQKAE